MSLPSDKPDRLVDARGYRCPVPTLRLQRALERVGDGVEIVLLADDPMVRIDVPHYAAGRGHEVVAITEQAGILRFVVRKGRDPVR